MKEQKAVVPHEEPVLLVHEVEDQNKRLDREVMYLLNKIRSHPPPSYKSANKTNATDNNGTKVCTRELGFQEQVRVGKKHMSSTNSLDFIIS